MSICQTLEAIESSSELESSRRDDAQYSGRSIATCPALESKITTKHPQHSRIAIQCVRFFLPEQWPQGLMEETNVGMFLGAKINQKKKKQGKKNNEMMTGSAEEGRK